MPGVAYGSHCAGGGWITPLNVAVGAGPIGPGTGVTSTAEGAGDGNCIRCAPADAAIRNPSAVDRPHKKLAVFTTDSPVKKWKSGREGRKSDLEGS